MWIPLAVAYWASYWARGYHDQPKSMLEWADCIDLDWKEPPIRLKYHNPTTIPRRWQTPMR